MTPVISVENLSKSYRLGQIGTGTLSRDLSVWWAKMRGKPNPLLKIGQEDKSSLDGETLWALRDVSFQVEQGEVLGIIGRNGAGKSTLLKILSRVTAPTSGRVKVKGRIASLLEVGTGFHPELTGRENVYLNGAILGMTREEVTRKFDEIVDFAEVEKFIDTPVKRYSSGMYVRLAFAVAAHLESEILLVDEVLAVGDAEFQKKCLGKMGDVAKQGRTVLFVSHNMASIRSLCSRGVLLTKGALIRDNEIQTVISDYVSMSENSKPYNIEDKTREGSGEYRFIGVSVLNKYGVESSSFGMGEPISIKLEIRGNVPQNSVIIGILISDTFGGTVLRAYSRESYIGSIKFEHPLIVITCDFENIPLMPGKYKVNLWLGKVGTVIDYVENAAPIEILASDIYNSGFPPDTRNGGVCFTKHSWAIEERPN